MDCHNDWGRNREAIETCLDALARHESVPWRMRRYLQVWQSPGTARDWLGSFGRYLVNIERKSV